MDLATRSFANTSPVKLPAIGFGTFEATPGDEGKCEAAVRAALQTGYRLIDTASLYGSEEAVGKAIKASGVPREKILLCTKFWNHYHHLLNVKRSCEESLTRLNVEYVDIFLMHWPLAFKRTDDFKELRGEDGKPIIDTSLSTNHESTWRAMESLVSSGKVRAIGVSNFNVTQLKELLSIARIKPACNQVESHPWLPQTALLDFCNENQITFMAYSPLGSQSGPVAMHVIEKHLMDDETIISTARRLGIEPAQVILAWAVQRGTVPVPKSATPLRIRSNFSLPILPDSAFEEINSITVRDPSKIRRFVNLDGIWGTNQFPKD